MICQQQLATTACSVCGKLVCEIHQDKRTGICIDCKKISVRNI